LSHTRLRISVVIPTIGRLTTLRRALAHFRDQSVPHSDFEVIVAADSTAECLDEIDALLEEMPYQTRRVQGAGPGASSARNAGWRAAASPLLLFTDDDILAAPSMLEEHLSWHQRQPSRSIGVLGHVRWARELSVTPFMRWLEHGVQFNYPSIQGEETTWGNFYTANVSVKHELVELSGGFDEERLPYLYEDLDLALRMHQRDGFRLLYNRAARAEHAQSTDLYAWKQRMRRVAVAERRFVGLHPEFPPYFHDLLSDAVARPAATGRTERLARFIPGRVPLLGSYIWGQLDLFYRQSLAPAFLEAWKESEVQSSESRTPVSSGGSPPGGPK
jgi:glycosyltransferase involved in cell wall biosynthesis